MNLTSRIAALALVCVSALMVSGTASSWFVPTATSADIIGPGVGVPVKIRAINQGGASAWSNVINLDSHAVMGDSSQRGMDEGRLRI